MTEDEAKMKQCCGPEPCGHFNDNPYPARWCNTTACMAWRHTEPRQLQQIDREGRISVATGFCGLAGAPQ